MSNIPFNKPYIAGREIEYISQAIADMHTAAGGEFTHRSEKLLAELLGAAAVLLTTSCTHALEMTALLLDIKPGDEVIVPSFTFVSTANAFALRGARIVFTDIRPDTLNMDEDFVIQRLSLKTKAVAAVHYSGVGCEMGRLLPTLEDKGISLIEDNAHGLLGERDGKLLGSVGRFSTLSFHETKNFSCGEGGALVLNNAEDVERAEIIRDKGTNRRKFYLGKVDKYTWVDIGSSYPPSDILSAFLLAQLEERDVITRKRAKLWNTYRDCLKDWATQNGIALPFEPEGARHTHHAFYLILNSETDRNSLMKHLNDRGTMAVFHYQPLHLSAMGESFGAKQGDCPVSEDISGRLLRLPIYNGMEGFDQERVIASCLEWHA